MWALYSFAEASLWSLMFYIFPNVLMTFWFLCKGPVASSVSFMSTLQTHNNEPACACRFPYFLNITIILLFCLWPSGKGCWIDDETIRRYFWSCLLVNSCGVRIVSLLNSILWCWITQRCITGLFIRCNKITVCYRRCRVRIHLREENSMQMPEWVIVKCVLFDFIRSDILYKPTSFSINNEQTKYK